MCLAVGASRYCLDGKECVYDLEVYIPEVSIYTTPTIYRGLVAGWDVYDFAVGKMRRLEVGDVEFKIMMH